MIPPAVVPTCSRRNDEVGVDVSLVVPLRCGDPCDGHGALVVTLRELRDHGVDVVVADGSDQAKVLKRHRGVFARLRHVVVAPRDGSNGKVAGVWAGMVAAMHERVVLADDDVSYDARLLRAVASGLDDADLVVPQNYFVGALRWHTVWDTGRTLLNRAFGHDYPGTMAVRRSLFMRIGGYRDDVLFENLELVRTIRAAGGRVRWAPDLFVPRRAPTVAIFADQRVRQAYDDFAQIPRLVIEASTLPGLSLVVKRRPAAAGGLALAVIAAAEVGRRLDGGRSRFSPIASLVAPIWVLERAVCVWVAIGARIFKGGVRYRGGRLRKAASSRRDLRRRFRASAPPLRELRRTAASSVSDRSDTAVSPVV
jgi:hypothetical protein